MNPTHGGWLILLSVIVALVLSVAHTPFDLPQWTDWLRPDWMVMVVFYWVMELPQRFGLITAWVLGLVVDACLADPLGVNGACLATLTYVTWSLYERFRMYSLLQQGGVIFLIVLFTESVRLSAHMLTREAEFSGAIIFPAIISMLVWPFLAGVLSRLSRSLVTA